MHLRGGSFSYFLPFVYIVQLFVYIFQKIIASQTHFGFSNMRSNMHRFSATAISFWLFSNGTPCRIFETWRTALYFEILYYAHDLHFEFIRHKQQINNFFSLSLLLDNLETKGMPILSIGNFWGGKNSPSKYWNMHNSSCQ